MSEKQVIITYLKKPSGYATTQEEWERALADALDFGCDWLEHLVDKMNPMPAQAVEELCVRFADIEAQAAAMRTALESLSHNDLFLENCSSWHDTGHQMRGVQQIAQSAIKGTAGRDLLVEVERLRAWRKDVLAFHDAKDEGEYDQKMTELIDAAAGVDLMRSELERLRTSTHSSEHQCDKCGFVTNRQSDVCPNDGSPLRHVTWEAAAKEARRLFLSEFEKVERLRGEKQRVIGVAERYGWKGDGKLLYCFLEHELSELARLRKEALEEASKTYRHAADSDEQIAAQIAAGTRLAPAEPKKYSHDELNALYAKVKRELELKKGTT